MTERPHTAVTITAIMTPAVDISLSIAAVSADVPPESEPFVPAESAGTRRRNDGRAASGSDGADEILQTSESIDVRR